MLFYIFWGFTAFILLVLIVVVLFTFIRGNMQKSSWKEILKMLFKGVGIVVVTYIVLFYVGGYIFMSSYKKECGPDSKEVEVMKPQAEVITNYILKHGMPKSMAEIENLPYPWDRCVREGRNVENCYFYINDNEYRTKLYFLGQKNDMDIYIKIYNQKSETGILTDILEKSNIFEVTDHLKPYSTKSDGICNPMRM